MSILKEIPELVEADVISQDTAEKIRDYYRQKGGQSQGKLFIIFGILGAILVGLGIMLIIAHNWDDLSRTSKTGLAFLPLIAGQALCVFTLVKKEVSVAWRESASAFLFFAVGASISLISQIYHIPGNLGAFILTWMLLCLPLIYLMKSSVTSLLYLIGITYYAGETCYWSHPSSESYIYWILLLLALPHYYLLYKKRPESNFMIFHNWLVPLSIIITLGTVSKSMEELMFVAYTSLFGLFYLIGNTPFFKRQSPRNNAYLTLGSLGTLSILLTLSFNRFWEKLRTRDLQFYDVISSPEFIAILIISLMGAGLLYLLRKNKPFTDIQPTEPVFILFIFIFVIGLSSPLSVVLVNFLVFTIGVLTIKSGAKLNHLGILNYGLLIIMALVICKFFDSNLTFVTRGILFVSVGVGFFVANYLMLKKRNKHE